jgi:sensor c-di-GMP phosphodiesterase-like protein
VTTRVKAKNNLLKKRTNEAMLLMPSVKLGATELPFVAQATIAIIFKLFHQSGYKIYSPR